MPFYGNFCFQLNPTICAFILVYIEILLLPVLHGSVDPKI
jgi:hypothetical protein